jgi:hypothetical protein
MLAPALVSLPGRFFCVLALALFARMGTQVIGIFLRVPWCSLWFTLILPEMNGPIAAAQLKQRSAAVQFSTQAVAVRIRIA